MKKINLLFCFIGFGSLLIAQTSLEKALSFKESGVIINSYKDVIVRNVDNEANWPALGIMREEYTFYYQLDYMQEEILEVISATCEYSAVKYSEYFVYDSGQDLKYYIYSSGDVEKIYEISEATMQLISETNGQKFMDNYFLPEDYLKDKKLLVIRSDELIKYCGLLWNVPNYSQEVLRIREVYKNTNALNNLIERKNGNVVGYYNNNLLVKVIVKMEGIREYYVENGNLVFAYYAANENHGQQRFYFYNNIAFKYLLDKENILRISSDFDEQSSKVLEEYREAILSL